MIRKIVYFVLIVLILSSLRFIAREVLPPPPLSHKDLQLYEDAIAVAQSHDSWGNFAVWEGVYGFSSEIWQQEGDIESLSKKDKKAVSKIQEILDGTSTMSIRRYNNVIFFVKSPTPFLQRTPAYFYSPGGKDSIEKINMIIINDADIYPLGNGWYAIKQITYVGGGVR